MNLLFFIIFNWAGLFLPTLKYFQILNLCCTCLKKFLGLSTMVSTMNVQKLAEFVTFFCNAIEPKQDGGTQQVSRLKSTKSGRVSQLLVKAGDKITQVKMSGLSRVLFLKHKYPPLLIQFLILCFFLILAHAGGSDPFLTLRGKPNPNLI